MSRKVKSLKKNICEVSFPEHTCEVSFPEHICEVSFPEQPESAHWRTSIILITQCHVICHVDGHVLILTHFRPNFRTFKFTSGKLILGFFCIGVLLQMLQWGTTSLGLRTLTPGWGHCMRGNRVKAATMWVHHQWTDSSTVGYKPLLKCVE
jgi:hypothetical protein